MVFSSPDPVPIRKELQNKMTFPKDYEDKVILNIVWAYFTKMITKKQMQKRLDFMDHSFKHLFDKKTKKKK